MIDEKIQRRRLKIGVIVLKQKGIFSISYVLRALEQKDIQIIYFEIVSIIQDLVDAGRLQEYGTYYEVVKDD